MRKYYLFLYLMLLPMTMWGQSTRKLSATLAAVKQETVSEQLIPVVISLYDPIDRVALQTRTSALRSSEARRTTVLQTLSRERASIQSPVVSILEQAVRQNHAADLRVLILGNVITCQVSPSLLRRLEQLPQVEWIDTDRKSNPIPELKENPVEKPSTRSASQPTWSVDYVEAPRVWNELGVTGKGVVVAILDSGVDYNHPDLKGNMWTSPEYPHHGWNFVSNNNDPMDDHGHGSHCAGIIAGNRSGALSCGIAPEATIMAVKVLDERNMGQMGSYLNGLNFAVKNGAHLISASIGFPNLPQETRNLFRRVYDDLASLNIISAIAAGNSGSNKGESTLFDVDLVDIPGAIPSPWIAPESTIRAGTSSVIAVGAVDRKSQLSSFSSTGPSYWELPPYNDYLCGFGVMPGIIKPDLSAPGTDVISLKKHSTGYVSMSGTSMATPCVAGVIALMKSKNPTLTLEQIDWILENSATKLSKNKNNLLGSGIVNAYAAVSAVLLDVPSRLWLETTVEGERLLTWEGAPDETTLAGYAVYADGNKIGETSLSQREYIVPSSASYKSYSVSSRYKTGNESNHSNVVIDQSSQDMYPPFNFRASRVGSSNNVYCTWLSPYEDRLLRWCNDMIPSLNIYEDVVKYVRTRFTPEKMVEVNNHRIKTLFFQAMLDKNAKIFVKLINGTQTLMEQEFVALLGEELETFSMDVTKLAGVIDYNKDLIVEIYTPEVIDFCSAAVPSTPNKLFQGMNYFSYDGKVWNEQPEEYGNWTIYFQFESLMVEPVATQRIPLGYNLYDNEEKVNQFPITTTNYVIESVPEGKHTYTVSSIFEEKELLAQNDAVVVLKAVHPLMQPVQITQAEQRGRNLFLKWNWIENTSNYLLYQDGALYQAVNADTAIVTAPSVGTHRYYVEAMPNDSVLGRSKEVEVEMIDKLLPPEFVQARLSGDSVLLSWNDRIKRARYHDNSTKRLSFFYPRNNNIPDFYIGQKWNAEDLKPFMPERLRSVIFCRGSADSVDFCLYHNQEKKIEQRFTFKSGDHDMVTFSLPQPIEFTPGDSLFVSLHAYTHTEKILFYDRGPANEGKGDLFSLDGKTWESMGRYEESNTGGNWIFTLLFAGNETEIDPYDPIPSTYQVYRNGEFVSLLNSRETSIIDRLPQYGNYVYTVMSGYERSVSAPSMEVTVGYYPTSVPSTFVKSNIYTEGNRIVIDQASSAGILRIYSSDGQLLQENPVIEGRNVINTSLSRNVYVVKLQMQQHIESTKIHID